MNSQAKKEEHIFMLRKCPLCGKKNIYTRLTCWKCGCFLEHEEPMPYRLVDGEYEPASGA